MLDTFTWQQLVLGGLAAFLVGLSKTGVPGLGILTVLVMAFIFGARASVGILLPLLIAGDIFAIAYYRRHAQWPYLLRMAPAVVAGLLLGWVLLRLLPASVFGPLLGAMILALLLVDVLRRCGYLTVVPHSRRFIFTMGCLAGLATTLGNAAGPVMGIYLVSLNLPKEKLMGTNAWFFFLVNSTKVPLFVTQNPPMIDKHGMIFDACVIPLVVLGAMTGVKILPKIPQKQFEIIILVLAGLAAVKLLCS